MGKLQNEDFKSSAELVAAGATAAQLLNDTKVYVTGNSINDTLYNAVVNGQLGGLAAWTTSHAYIVGNVVTYEKCAYICLTNHTSAATIEADVASGYWQLLNLPQVGRNYMLVGNNFEDNDAGGWTVCKSGTMSNAFPTAVGSGGNAFSSSNGGTTATTAQAITIESAAPLSGKYSMKFTTSSGGTTAGDMYISQAYNIDICDQAKPLQIKFDYKLAGDTNSLTNFSGTSSNTFGVAIYDLINNAWIQPAGVFNFVQKTGVGTCLATFQTTSNMTKFQIAVYCATATGATTVTLLLDDFYVGPQPFSVGAAMSDWASFTPTGSWTTATSYTGVWRRVGDTMEIHYVASFSGAPDAGALTLNMPSGYTIDSTKINTTQDAATLGSAALKQSGQNWQLFPVLDTTTKILLTYSTNTNIAVSPVTKTAPATIGNGDIIVATIRVPIVGWSSNTVQSADTDTRVVAASAYRNGAITLSTVSQQISYDSVIVDTHGGFLSGVYTVTVSGYYSIRTTTEANVTTSNSYLQSSIYIGNSSIKNVVSQPSNSNYLVVCNSYTAYFPAGTAISSQALVGGSTASVVTGTATMIEINRLSGPATVQATESINASYYLSTNSSAARIPFDTKIFDSHNAATTGASFAYTAQISGVYSISVAAIAASGTNNLQLYKNGSFYSLLASQVSTTAIGAGTIQFKMNAGDTCWVQNPGTITLTGGAPSSNGAIMSIMRVGN